MENQEPTMPPILDEPQAYSTLETAPAKLPKQNIILVVAILAIIVISFLVIILSPKKTATKHVVTAPVPTPTPAPYVQSGLTISTPKKNANNTYSTNVEISTSNNKVTGVQLEMTYDPKVLTNMDIKYGNFFTSPSEFLKKVDPVKGVILYSFYVNATQKSASGSGTVATLTFSAAPGTKNISTKISFLPTTEVVALGQFESVLKHSSDLAFVVK